MTRGPSGRAPWLAAFVAVTMACAPEAMENGPAWVGERGPETLEGAVRLAGNEPFVRTLIEPEGGESATVEGPYRGEIGRLSGALVRLTGRYGEGDYAGPTFEATSYEILSVDGDRPLLGRLEAEGDGFRLVAPQGGVTPLSAVSEALAAHEGALVWVVLDARGGVARHGVLREPR